MNQETILTWDQRQALKKAAREGKPKEVQKILKGIKDLGPEGADALAAAVRVKDPQKALETTKALLAKGASWDPDMATVFEMRDTPQVQAAKAGRVEILKLILESDKSRPKPKPEDIFPTEALLSPMLEHPDKLPMLLEMMKEYAEEVGLSSKHKLPHRWDGGVAWHSYAVNVVTLPNPEKTPGKAAEILLKVLGNDLTDDDKRLLWAATGELKGKPLPDFKEEFRYGLEDMAAVAAGHGQTETMVMCLEKLGLKRGEATNDPHHGIKLCAHAAARAGALECLKACHEWAPQIFVCHTIEDLTEDVLRGAKTPESIGESQEKTFAWLCQLHKKEAKTAKENRSLGFQGAMTARWGSTKMLEEIAPQMTLQQAQNTLAWAIDENRLDSVLFLLDHKKSPHREALRKSLTERGEPQHLDDRSARRMFLASAIGSGNVKILEALIERGLPKDLRLEKALSPGWGKTEEGEGLHPVLIAASKGHLEMAKLMVSLGFDPHEKEDSALVSAVVGGREECVDYLLKQGANPATRDHEAAYNACYNRRPALRDVLLAHYKREDLEDLKRAVSASNADHPDTKGYGQRERSELKRAVESALAALGPEPKKGKKTKGSPKPDPTKTDPTM
jgi:hypothetical protein